MSNYNLNDQNVDSWSEHNVEYQFHTPEKPNAISLMMAGQDEMLRITEHGFYVRGKKVPQDDREAAVVYNAFKQWLAWANLQR
jgi:hypothetical protein